MSTTQNVPYVRQYDENGEVTNPITKDSPYRSGIGRAINRVKEYRFMNNKKGVRTIAGVSFGLDENGKQILTIFKVRRFRQTIGTKTIMHEQIVN